ncbi:MAG: PAS domain S-box protein [Actinomycetota bacterium]
MVVVLGYLYQVPSLHRLPGYGSMALHTALTLLATGLGVMLLKPERLAIAARNSGGILLRRLFPATVVALIVLGWLQVEAQRNRLTDAASGISVMVAVRLVILSGLIAWTASSLRKVERGRLAAEQALRDLNLDLEDRVRVRTAELMASEKRAASIIATSADGFVSIDAGSRITDWNRQAELTFGWSKEEVLGLKLTETIIPVRFAAAHEKGISRFLATGEGSVIGKRVEMTAVHRDCREFPVEMAVWATSDGDGWSFNAFLKDITQRKQAENRLRESEERFRLLAETAPVGIYRWDSQGRCTYVNKAWSAITGLSAEQATGDGWAGIVHPDESARVISARREATDNSLDLQLRYRVRTPDGVEKWVDSRAVAIKGDDILSIRGYVGTMIDVTTQVEAEIAVAAARDEALAASKSKSQFLATMSHEIRTPMNGVIGLTELLLDSPLSSNQRTYAEGVKVSGEALLGIINNILDFSKNEAGKLVLEEVEFNPARTVEQVGGLIAEPARAGGLEVLVQTSPALPQVVRGDEGRLRQILMNLATNAVKFTAEGRVVLRVFPEGPPAGGRVPIRFEVVDTGPGIAGEVAEKLFQPFAQADASTTRHYGGTGLGLAICRQLATAMGGDVGLTSLPGEGSTFWLRLGFPTAQGDAYGQTPPAAVPGAGRARHGRILVVEDHPINQQVAMGLLAELGYSSEVASNGLEALEALTGSSYDAILMDCHMPGMDGFQATEELRRREGALVHTPIIAMTASALEEDRQKCLAAGMDDYLAKPIRDGELEAVLGRWIPLDGALSN